jgi:chorismate lyase
MRVTSPQSIQIPTSPLSQSKISAWNRIEEPMWQGSEDDIRKGLPFNLLSPTWQMFLMGDGAPTRHLQLLTQSDISVDVLAMTNIGDDDDNAPQGFADRSFCDRSKQVRSSPMRHHGGQRRRCKNI